jgi:putative PIN family toxin of toxin-antitoxin system
LRALFDTNVLIAAFLTEGLCSKLLGRAKRKHFELYTCPFVLAELEEKLAKKFYAAKGEIKETLTLIKEASLTVNPASNNIMVNNICRDTDDDNVLACALAAKADYLVTGDSDLLIIGVFRGIKIITPREFELLFEDV